MTTNEINPFFLQHLSFLCIDRAWGPLPVDHTWCVVFGDVELSWSGHGSCWVRQHENSRPHWRGRAKFTTCFAHPALGLPGLSRCSPSAVGNLLRGLQNPFYQITQMDLLCTLSPVFTHNLFSAWQSDSKLSWAGAFFFLPKMISSAENGPGTFQI